MLKMLASVRPYICARWKGLMRPCGESMKTFTRDLPLRACSADEPVSPLVAPRTFSRRSCLAEHMLEEVADQLHRDVLERERRAVGAGEQVQVVLERPERRDLGRAEHLLRVGALGKRLQLPAREIVGEEAQDLEGELRIGQVAQRVQLRPRDPRPLLGHGEPAVRGEALEQDVGEGLVRGVAASRYVFHGLPAGTGCTSTMPAFIRAVVPSNRSNLSPLTGALPGGCARRGSESSAAPRWRGWRRSRRARGSGA